MTQEQGQSERRRRHFTDLERKMLSWMVFEYDERLMIKPDVEMAQSMGIDVLQVKEALKRLEERGKCDRTKALTLAVRLAAINGEFSEFDTSRIPIEPNEPLTAKEALLKSEFSVGNNNSQIMANIGESFEGFNKLKGKLIRKFNATNRFLIAASDALRKLKERQNST